jgi:hypothetical protein
VIGFSTKHTVRTAFQDVIQRTSNYGSGHTFYTGSVMSEDPKGPSWTLMLILIVAAILVAMAIAYKMIAPFFHH